MSVSPEAVPVLAGADEAAADDAGAAAEEAGAAADDVDEPLLVTADEPHADSAATASAAAAMPATRRRGRPGLRVARSGLPPRYAPSITPQWVLGFSVDLGALAELCDGLLVIQLESTLALPTITVNGALRP